MVNTEQKDKFIELRAQGFSLESIAKQLKISKPTAIKMNKELELEINRLKLIDFEALAIKYKMVRSARIESTGKLLERLDTALEAADFDRLSPIQLLELRFKLVDRMKAELDFEYWEPGKFAGIESDSYFAKLD